MPCKGQWGAAPALPVTRRGFRVAEVGGSISDPDQGAGAGFSHILRLLLRGGMKDVTNKQSLSG